MVDDINKMLKIVADATTELEDKISQYLGEDIGIDIDNIDYESFNVKIFHTICPNMEVQFDYHVLMDSLEIYYTNWDNSTFIKIFKNIDDALEDIKDFLNKEEN